MLKTIEKPDLSAIKIEQTTSYLKLPAIQKLIQKSLAPYSHWEKVKYFLMPDHIKPVELWSIIKLLRQHVFEKKHSPITSEYGKSFSWLTNLPGLEELLHQVDMKLGGNLFTAGQDLDEAMRRQFLSRGIMEEAIASSQLEGANTTRKVAKQMLIEKRQPRTDGERMILNNYEAMLFIEHELKDRPLDEAVFMELHSILTRELLEPEEIGHYRKDTDEIVVGDDEYIYHIPPRISFVNDEMKKLFDYANNTSPSNGFVHPIIKAIILHFWIGYLHPFVDGNGRIARAIFYWYLLRENYWAFCYLPLSKVIKNSPGQYRDAYIYAEQDDNDLTYFIDYNVSKIRQALKEFELYAERKSRENKLVSKITRDHYNLNERQIQLLRYFNKNSDATTSLSTHCRIYNITRVTGIKDLKGLEQLGFTTSKKIGRQVLYSPTKKLDALFN